MKCGFGHLFGYFPVSLKSKGRDISCVYEFSKLFSDLEVQ